MLRYSEQRKLRELQETISNLMAEEIISWHVVDLVREEIDKVLREAHHRNREEAIKFAAQIMFVCFQEAKKMGMEEMLKSSLGDDLLEVQEKLRPWGFEWSSEGSFVNTEKGTFLQSGPDATGSWTGKDGSFERKLEVGNV